MIPGLTQIRLALLAVVLVIAGVALAKFGLHERGVEVAKQQKADAVVEKQADQGTEANAVKAAIAARGAEDDQKAIDAYIAAHPAQPLQLCDDQDRGRPPGVRPAGGALPAPGGASTGPAAVPPVLGRDEGGRATGTDVDPGVDAILRATEALDVLYRERQRR